MKKNIFIIAMLVCLYLPSVHAQNAEASKEIKWTTLADASKNADNKSDKKDKLIFVDFYTDWCGWCKRLDQTTYIDPRIVEEINAHFLAVKFDAEQKDDAIFFDRTYAFVPSGSRGTHQFAIENAAKSGRIGYPTITIFTEKGERLAVEPGYKDADHMLLLLKYYGEGFYKSMSYADFEIAQKSSLMAN